MNNIFILQEILNKIENKEINRLKTFTENETCNEIRLKNFPRNVNVFTVSQQLSFTYDVFTNIWAKFSKFLHKTKTWLRKLYVKVDLLEIHFFCIFVGILISEFKHKNCRISWHADERILQKYFKALIRYYCLVLNILTPNISFIVLKNYISE